MTSHIKQKLVDIRKALDKVVHDEHKPDHEEQVLDELAVLESITMTAELIRESKLGKVVSSIKDKFETVSTKVAAKAKEILLHWKKIVEDHQKAQKPLAQSHASSKSGESVAKFNLTTYPESHNSEDLKNYISSLSASRHAIVKIFTNCFKDITSQSNAEAVGASIERELDLAFPAESSVTAKQYSARAKLLSFNIKKNEILRDNVLNGSIVHKDLIHMTAAEMASQTQKDARELMNLENIDKRRLDWLEAHKEDIQLDIGIDPANTWEYDDGEDGMSEPDADPPDI